MKVCMKCGHEKPIEEFYKHKKMSDGRLNKCKECTKKDVAENQSKIGTGYDYSEKGVVRVIYKTQKRNQKTRGHGDLPYSKESLSTWLYDNGFKKLYDDWLKSGFSRELKPSVDRLDSIIGYSFENMQLITWGKNRKLQAIDISSGTGSSGKRCKKVLKFDSEKKLICSYVSYRSASNEVGHSIEYAIKKGTKCKSGFYWAYEV